MNKRIQQLVEQAGLKHHNWITNESNVTDGDFKYPRLEDYEKFTKLIVQECIQMCDQAAKQSEATLHAILAEKNPDLGPTLVAKGAQIQAEKLSKNINQHFFGAD